MEWNLKKAIVKEAEYTADCWHMHKREEHVYVTNWTLMDYPAGGGATEKDAFEKMLMEIEIYKTKLDAVKAEIEAHLAKLEGKENA